MKKIEATEAEIQLSICEYLETKRHFFWRQNVSPTITPDGKGFRRMPKYSKNGVPDIIVIKDGFFIGLECKRKGAKQRDSQKKFEKDSMEAGAEYHLVSSIDDVQAIGL